MSRRGRLGPLNPLGTARALVGEPARGLPFPASLSEAVREHDLPEGALYLAWEIARVARGIDDPAREALLVLLLATLINVRQGSTRMPLPAPAGTKVSPLSSAKNGDGDGDGDGRAFLAERLESLKIDPAARDQVWALVETLRAKTGPWAGGVVGRPDDFLPLILDGDHLYQQRMLHYEKRLVAALGARLSAPPIEVAEAKVDQVLAEVAARPTQKGGNSITLSDEQVAAVRKALVSPLTVISGGPGTGKTSIVVTILRALARLGVGAETIALGAPTGKAAHRMDEAVKQSLQSIAGRDATDEALLAGCPDPKTLHRLLGYSPSRDSFKHHGQNRLSERVVIVDECSMIDLFLMDQLVRSVRDDARLILLGDADQLPSVDAGAVFRDLIPSDPEERAESAVAAMGGAAASPAKEADPRRLAAVRLTYSYRMDPTDPSGRAILTAGRLINASEVEKLLAPTGAHGAPMTRRASSAELKFDQVEFIDSAADEEREALLLRWYRERVARPEFERHARKVYRHGEQGFDAADQADLKALFKHFESFRILCVTRGDARPTGAEAVNARLHRLVLEGARSHGLKGRRELYSGEPVMVQHNDYERSLFNGDQGLVLRVSEGGAPEHRMAVFPRKEEFAVFHLAALRAEIRLSFAITVHKGQGSEFDYVALLLPGETLPILTRELLYTAVTRSRKSVVILGGTKVLSEGVNAKLRRFSGIGERLAASGPEGG